MHITFHYPGLNLGGQQTYTVGLMTELAALGHRVSWIYHHGDALLPSVKAIGTAHRIRMPRFNEGRFGVQRVCNRVWYRSAGVRQIRDFCLREDVEVLVSANTPDSIIGGRVAAGTETRHFRMLGGSMKQVEPHWLARWQSLGIDEHITGYFGWPAVFDELAEAGVAPEKCVALPMPVDASRHFPLPLEVRRSTRRSLGIPEDTLVIGWIGRVALNMQVWDTVRLAKMLRDSGFEDFWLLLVGGGDAHHVLEAEIRAAGLADRSVTTGWIPYERMNELTNAMDIVPLLEADPHGGSIVREAMAAGRVALSVDGPSRVQSEFMKPEHSVLVPSADYLGEAMRAVLALAGERDRLERLGVRAARYARDRMSFRRVAEAFLGGVDALR